MQHHRAEALKDRLDRTYLESLSTADIPQTATKAPDATDDSFKIAQEDLRLLYTEIDDVAGLAVAHDHVERVE